MSTEPDREPQGGGVVAGLLAPLRLPERMMEMLDSLADAAGDVGAIRAELTRVRKHTEPLDDLMPAVDRVLEQTQPVTELLPLVESLDRQAEPLAELLPALARIEERLGTRLDSLHEDVRELAGHEAHLTSTVDRLVGELGDINRTVSKMKDDLEQITERLPDPDAPGPLEKARDMFTGRGD